MITQILQLIRTVLFVLTVIFHCFDTTVARNP
jgi:hypothetical protein